MKSDRNYKWIGRRTVKAADPLAGFLSRAQAMQDKKRKDRLTTWWGACIGIIAVVAVFIGLEWHEPPAEEKKPWTAEVLQEPTAPAEPPADKPVTPPAPAGLPETPPPLSPVAPAR